MFNKLVYQCYHVHFLCVCVFLTYSWALKLKNCNSFSTSLNVNLYDLGLWNVWTSQYRSRPSTRASRTTSCCRPRRSMNRLRTRNGRARNALWSTAAARWSARHVADRNCDRSHWAETPLYEKASSGRVASARWRILWARVSVRRARRRRCCWKCRCRLEVPRPDTQ